MGGLSDRLHWIDGCRWGLPALPPADRSPRPRSPGQRGAGPPSLQQARRATRHDTALGRGLVGLSAETSGLSFSAACRTPPVSQAASTEATTSRERPPLTSGTARYRAGSFEVGKAVLAPERAQIHRGLVQGRSTAALSSRTRAGQRQRTGMPQPHRRNASNKSSPSVTSTRPLPLSARRSNARAEAARSATPTRRKRPSVLATLSLLLLVQSGRLGNAG
jgi:hypothetical protein